MEMLDVRLFGGLRLSRGAAELPPFPTRKAAALFGFLVLHRDQSIHREVICSRLWRDRTEAESRKALRTALWRIRCVIEPDDDQRGTFLRVDTHRVGFRPVEEVSVDAWELDDTADLRPPDGADARLSEADLARLHAARRLYSGGLLEGEEADDWIVAEAERYRLMHLTVLERLMSHHRVSGNLLDALAVGQEILREDPLLEHVHRALMMCHLEIGDRASAIRQYRACVDVLADELGISPMARTIELNERILSGAVH